MNAARVNALIDQAEHLRSMGEEKEARKLLVLAGLEADDGYWRRRYNSATAALWAAAAYGAIVTLFNIVCLWR